jgi:tetratricopeptide (TPR) repeat protein
MKEPVSVHEALDIAIACFREEEFGTVIGVCDEILRAEPANVDALHLRGLAHASCDNQAQAIHDLKHALLIRPGDFELLNNLGNIYKGTSELQRARECYEAALQAAPECYAAWFNLANVLSELGQIDESIRAYERAENGDPEFVEASYRHAQLLAHEGRLVEAVAKLKQCIARDTNHADAQIQLGHCFAAMGKVEEALNAYRVAEVVDPTAPTRFGGARALLVGDLEQAAEFFSDVVAAQPESAAGYRWLGRTLLDAGSFDDAIMVYRTAVRLQPTAPDVQLEMATAYAKGGYAKQAVEYFEHVEAVRPGSFAPVLGRAIAMLPDHDAFDAAVDVVQALAPTDSEAIDDAVRALSLLQPDNLRRLPGNHRELMTKFGTLITRVMSLKYPQWSEPLSMPLRDAGGRVRVGIVSRKHHDRHNWRTVSGGILENLPIAKFQLFEYPTKGVSFETLCSRIRGDYLHVLVFPDLDEVAWQMAALRLAPVQCTTWARTETTGLPSMDYFLSSELAEPVDGATHYSERLVKLPGCFMYYDPQMDKNATANVGDVFEDPAASSDVPGIMVALQLNMPVVTMRGTVAKARRGAALLKQIGLEETIAETKEEYDAIVDRLKSDESYWQSVSKQIAERKFMAFKDHETIAAFEKWIEALV